MVFAHIAAWFKTCAGRRKQKRQDQAIEIGVGADDFLNDWRDDSTYQVITINTPGMTPIVPGSDFTVRGTYGKPSSPLRVSSIFTGHGRRATHQQHRSYMVEQSRDHLRGDDAWQAPSNWQTIGGAGSGQGSSSQPPRRLQVRIDSDLALPPVARLSTAPTFDSHSIRYRAAFMAQNGPERGGPSSLPVTAYPPRKESLANSQNALRSESDDDHVYMNDDYHTYIRSSRAQDNRNSRDQERQYGRPQDASTPHAPRPRPRDSFDTLDTIGEQELQRKMFAALDRLELEGRERMANMRKEALSKLNGQNAEHQNTTEGGPSTVGFETVQAPYFSDIPSLFPRITTPASLKSDFGGGPDPVQASIAAPPNQTTQANRIISPSFSYLNIPSFILFRNDANPDAGKTDEDNNSNAGKSEDDAHSDAGKPDEDVNSNAGKSEEDGKSNAGKSDEDGNRNAGKSDEDENSNAGKSNADDNSTIGISHEDGNSNAGKSNGDGQSTTWNSGEDGNSTAGKSYNDGNSDSGNLTDVDNGKRLWDRWSWKNFLPPVATDGEGDIPGDYTDEQVPQEGQNDELIDDESLLERLDNLRFLNPSSETQSASSQQQNTSTARMKPEWPTQEIMQRYLADNVSDPAIEMMRRYATDDISDPTLEIMGRFLTDDVSEPTENAPELLMATVYRPDEDWMENTHVGIVHLSDRRAGGRLSSDISDNPAQPKLRRTRSLYEVYTVGAHRNSWMQPPAVFTDDMMLASAMRSASSSGEPSPLLQSERGHAHRQFLQEVRLNPVAQCSSRLSLEEEPITTEISQNPASDVIHRMLDSIAGELHRPHSAPPVLDVTRRSFKCGTTRDRRRVYPYLSDAYLRSFALALVAAKANVRFWLEEYKRIIWIIEQRRGHIVLAVGDFEEMLVHHSEQADRLMQISLDLADELDFLMHYNVSYIRAWFRDGRYTLHEHFNKLQELDSDLHRIRDRVETEQYRILRGLMLDGVEFSFESDRTRLLEAQIHADDRRRVRSEPEAASQCREDANSTQAENLDTAADTSDEKEVAPASSYWFGHHNRIEELE